MLDRRGFIGAAIAAAGGAAFVRAGAPQASALPAATNRPPQPSAMIWETDGGQYMSSYAKPGALVTVGRTNYGDQFAKNLAAGGASVVIYLDPMISWTWGRYHTLLLNESTYGPQVARWPGNIVVNPDSGDDPAFLNDFRVGSILQQKLESILELMISENPHAAGFLLDDVGTRSWYPGFDFDAWSAADKLAYRNGAINIVQTARTVADRRDLLVFVNGTWGANDGGGYPNAAAHGCSLVDGGVIENHPPSDIPYFTAYAASAQWASATPRNKSYMWVWNINDPTTRNTWVQANVPAFALAQSDRYTAEQPWAPISDFGLPRGARARNGIANPALQSNANGWTGGTGTGSRISTAGFDRPNAFRQTGTTNLTFIETPKAPVHANEQWTGSISVRSSVAMASWAARTYLEFYDSAGNHLGDSGATNFALTANAVTRITRTATTPANAAQASMSIYLNLPSSTTKFDATMARLTNGAVNTYADGSSTNWEWDGTSGSSTSSAKFWTP